jgi:hypothetical protein
MCVLSLRESQNALTQQSCGWAVAGLDRGIVHLDLAAGELWRARGDQRGHVIICCHGVVWITQKRDVVDYMLQEGEIFIGTLPGLVLVQALEPASVTVVKPSIWTRPHATDYCTFARTNLAID